MNKKTKNKILISFLGIFLFFAGWQTNVYFSKQRLNRKRFLSLYQERVREDVFKNSLLRLVKGFSGEAAIIIKDLNDGWEFAYQKDKPFAAASLTKIPLMVACFEAAKKGRLKLDSIVSLKTSYKLSGSGFLKDLPSGMKFSIERLVGLMIYESDNTATNILTQLLGTDYLNKAFAEFGLQHTRLSRRIADYDLRDRGIENYTTAQDMALLLEKIYRKDFGREIYNQCVSILKLTRINDRIPKYLPSELTIAHKTGLERQVCHDAGIVFLPETSFIIVVLTRHDHNNSIQAKEFIAQVSHQAYNFFKKKKQGI